MYTVAKHTTMENVLQKKQVSIGQIQVPPRFVPFLVNTALTKQAQCYVWHRSEMYMHSIPTGPLRLALKAFANASL